MAVIKGEGGGGGGGEEEGEEAEEVEATAAATEEATAAVASMTDALRDLAHYMGVSSSQKDCVAWLTALLEADKMVDSFAALHPHARHASPAGINTGISATRMWESASIIFYSTRASTSTLYPARR